MNGMLFGFDYLVYAVYPPSRTPAPQKGVLCQTMCSYVLCCARLTMSEGGVEVAELV